MFPSKTPNYYLQQLSEVPDKLYQCKYNLVGMLQWDKLGLKNSVYLLVIPTYQTSSMQLLHHMVHKLSQHSRIDQDQSNSFVELQYYCHHHEAEMFCEDLVAKDYFRWASVSFS